jgi:hypothetical protein
LIGNAESADVADMTAHAPLESIETIPPSRVKNRRRVTPVMLGAPDDSHPSWMEVGFAGESALHVSGRAGDILYLTEDFARSTLPAAAIAAMRMAPCFYVTVDSIADAVASTPGEVVGGAHEALGMRGLCVATTQGMLIFAEQAE